MKRAILITNIPNPYRIPLYNELSILLKKENIGLRVIFGSSGYSRRMFNIDKNEFKFDYHILDDKGHTFSKDGEKTYFLYRGLTGELKKYKPDVIIVAGFSSATMKIARYSLLNKVPFIVISGTIEQGNRNSSILRKIQRRLLASRASAFVSYGNLAKKYLLGLGVNESKVFIGRNTVDTNFFQEATNTLKSNQTITDNKTYFTYLGYLVPRKNVKKVLEAVNILSKETREFQLDIIGDGIEKSELEKYVHDNQLEDVVVFHGFKEKKEIPFYFAKSSGLLFQTDYDIWGLVLNEAMAAGVPCLASPNAGATYDLIDENNTGFIVNFDNPAEASNKMKWIIDHPAEAAKIGMNAAAFIKNNVTLKDACKGYIDAINYVLT